MTISKENSVMIDEHRAILADVIAEYIPEGDDGQDGLKNIAIADAGLAALVEAGYELVKLPHPNSDGRWSIASKNDLYAEDGEVIQFLPKSSGSAMAIRSPMLTRKIGAAYLAVARDAER